MTDAEFLKKLDVDETVIPQWFLEGRDICKSCRGLGKIFVKPTSVNGTDCYNKKCSDCNGRGEVTVNIYKGPNFMRGLNNDLSVRDYGDLYGNELGDLESIWYLCWKLYDIHKSPNGNPNIHDKLTQIKIPVVGSMRVRTLAFEILQKLIEIFKEK